MAQYTLAEAAKATGKSKSTILRSIKAGRISAVRDELSGGWLVEPAELHRLYAEHDAVRGSPNGEVRNGYRNGSDSLVSGAMAALHTRIAVAETEVRLKDEIIAELRRSIALLTDQRAAAVVPNGAASSKSPNASAGSDSEAVPNGTTDSPAPARRWRWLPWRR